MKKRIRVLVLEDNADDFYLLEETLELSERVRIEIVHFTRLQHAMDYTGTSEIDAAILDLAVPDSFGLDTYLTFSKAFPNIPVVVMTGYKNYDLAMEAMQKGAQEFIFKGDTSIGAIERTLLFSIERHRLLTELKASTRTIQKLNIAVEQSPVSIVITDAGGCIEYVNGKLCEITGYSKDELIGQNPRILKSGQVAPDVYEQLWKTLLSKNMWHGEFCNQKKNGDLYWEDAFISPVVDDDGRIINYIAIKEDITDKKALAQLKEDVNRIMAHDLKGPLTAIISLPEVLGMHGELNEKQKKVVRLVGESGHNMINMIDMSLDMIKMESGTYNYLPKQVDLGAVLFRLVQETHPGMTRKHLDCRIRIDGETLAEGMTVPVWSEEQLIYRLLSNLLKNAVEASPEYAVISIDIHRQDHISIGIENEGVVPEQIRRDFFGKYITYGKRKGTGLGTYSAKLMADAMQYEIRMETSDADDKTCVRIHIPPKPPKRDFNWLI
ncbi:MAG: PAS domain S-box protein [Desulfobacterales bacterium]|nr:PAS domain S-box protein [Desulfobacterales bacterium]